MFDPNLKVTEAQIAADTRKFGKAKAKLEKRPKLNVIERACLSLVSDMRADNGITRSWTHSELAHPPRDQSDSGEAELGDTLSAISALSGVAEDPDLCLTG